MVFAGMVLAKSPMRSQKFQTI